MVTISAPEQLLAELLATYLAGGDPDHPGEYSAAQRHQMLPVMGDFMGYWGLWTNGGLVFVPDDDSAHCEPVAGYPAERSSIHVALAIASRRYPALAPFCPQRPHDAVSCKSCDGHGRIPGAPDNIICECGGLGWLPPGLERAV